MTLNKTTESYSTITPVIVEDDSVDNSHIDITKDVAEEDKHLVQPAGVGAAIVGTIFFGPILGPLLGFSAAYGVRKNNSAGNLARAVGELTSSVQETADKIEEKVLALQQRKARLFTAVMDDEALFSQALTADDIRGLLES